MSASVKDNVRASATEANAAPRTGASPLEAFFGPKGPLAKKLVGYETRSEQITAARAVERAMGDGLTCLIEAGTGVGKTLAYLVPAVRAALNGKRTVISTHTINLQTQLVEKDIPLVLSLFPGADERISVTLMKGRGNYLCLQDLENARSDLFLMADPQFQRVRHWAGTAGCTGDVADLPFSFSAWSEISSNLDTCRGQECAFFDECHYYRMRRSAATSSLLVVNHALFLSDLALRRADPNSGILPEYDHVVFDEAHHLEEVATRAFGLEFGSRRLASLMERIRRVRGLDIDETRLKNIEEMSVSLFAPFMQSGKSEFFFDDVLEDGAVEQVHGLAGQTCVSLSALQNELLKIAADNEDLRERLEGIARMCGRAREELDQILSCEDANLIRWGDVGLAGRGEKKEPRANLHLTPISVADILSENLWHWLQARGGSAVLTSATLANSGGFSYQKSRLGLPDTSLETVVGSPFDFKRQALLYVPWHLPPPTSAAASVDKVADEIERVLTLTNGRAFLLFTSRAMLTAVYEILEGRLHIPLFRQGDMPSGRLIDAFKSSGNGCLFGVQTFWEGVDVQGEALSCVIIDRLPFAVPDSPITKARTQAIVDAGGDWFRDYAVPQAQIRLKQGFGRLIRTRTDRGIVCILDTRLIHKRYGAEFVRYLPPASRASKWSRVERFWQGSDVVTEPSATLEGQSS